MNALLDVIGRDPWKASAKPLSLAIVYEDSRTHREANEAYESLLRVLGEEGVLTAAWWRTSLLGDPKLALAAAQSIAASDLILIAARGDSSPSPSMRHWIENWPMDGNRAKLLVLLGSRHLEAGEWNRLLQEAARQRQMIFVANCLPPGHADQLQSGPEITFSNRFIEPYQHWGLNE